MSEIRRPWLELNSDPGFAGWLKSHACSLAVSTYQTGKLLLIGVDTAEAEGGGKLSVFERSFKHCMGLSANRYSLWIATRHQIWKLSPAPISLTAHGYGVADFAHSTTGEIIPAWVTRGYDFAYIPRIGYTTGYIDTHDLAATDNDEVFFVSTMFNCIATLSKSAGFRPYWQPKFISQLVPEDRCHLNGLAIKDDRPAYATCASLTNESEGWRNCRHNGGAVIDILNDEIICRGLSMPHSPRWHHQKLWLHNSGTGEFGMIEPNRGTFEPIVFCPGYLRGLSFHSGFAIATLSKPRNKTFKGLGLEMTLSTRKAEAVCGIVVISLATGRIEHYLEFVSEQLTEAYDVCVLTQARRPMAIGFQNDEIERFVIIESSEPLI